MTSDAIWLIITGIILLIITLTFYIKNKTLNEAMLIVLIAGIILIISPFILHRPTTTPKIIKSENILGPYS